jgi:hypothetical protein
MKVTKSQLKQIIKEELRTVTEFDQPDSDYDRDRDINTQQRKIKSKSELIAKAVARFDGATEAIINYLKVIDMLEGARRRGGNLEDGDTSADGELDDALYMLGDPEHAILSAFRKVYKDKIETK